MKLKRTVKMLIFSILRIGLLVYIGLCIYLFVSQSGMVFYPSKEILQRPSDINLAYEDIFFTTADGQRINGWFIPAENARGTVLNCHGNAGTIGDRLHTIQVYHDLGLNMFIFDYRGYGRSSGRPTEKGTYEDALGAWNYLTRERGIPPEKIVVSGRSLGGAVAAWLAEHTNPAAVIIESTFTSIPDMGARLYPYLPVRLLCRIRYNTGAHMNRIKCPVLITHSRDDEMIPFENGKKLFEAAREPKMFIELSGTHNDGEVYTDEPYLSKLDEFLTSHIGAVKSKDQS